jgi:hypothetical protein
VLVEVGMDNVLVADAITLRVLVVDIIIQKLLLLLLVANIRYVQLGMVSAVDKNVLVVMVAPLM